MQVPCVVHRPAVRSPARSERICAQYPPTPQVWHTTNHTDAQRITLTLDIIHKNMGGGELDLPMGRSVSPWPLQASFPSPGHSLPHAPPTNLGSQTHSADSDCAEVEIRTHSPCLRERRQHSGCIPDDVSAELLQGAAACTRIASLCKAKTGQAKAPRADDPSGREGALQRARSPHESSGARSCSNKCSVRTAPKERGMGPESVVSDQSPRVAGMVRTVARGR